MIIMMVSSTSAPGGSCPRGMGTSAATPSVPLKFLASERSSLARAPSQSSASSRRRTWRMVIAPGSSAGGRLLRSCRSLSCGARTSSSVAAATRTALSTCETAVLLCKYPSRRPLPRKAVRGVAKFQARRIDTKVCAIPRRSHGDLDCAHLKYAGIDLTHARHGERTRVPTQATDFWVLEPTRCQRSILHTHTHQTGELILMAKRRTATLPMRPQTSPN